MKRKEQENQELLYALINGGRRSDRELSKIFGVSQPIVTRKRSSLEKDGLIREYTIIPDLVNMGYDFVAPTFLSFSENGPELSDKQEEWAKNEACVVLTAKGEGLSKNSCMVSMHRSHGSYSKLITHLRRDWRPNLKRVEAFIIGLAQQDLLIKPFSFRYLEADK